jgi:hypothetical protein
LGEIDRWVIAVEEKDNAKGATLAEEHGETRDDTRMLVVLHLNPHPLKPEGAALDV